MSKRYVTILFVLCMITLIGMVISLTLTGKPTQEPFVPPEFDPFVALGMPDVPENLDWQKLDAKAFEVGISGVMMPKGNGLDVWLTNPQENEVWLKVRVLSADGNILGETGLIKPGEYVQTVSLKIMPSAGTPITLRVMAYEPETYHSAGAITVSTKIS